jgi:hypothetical protein
MLVGLILAVSALGVCGCEATKFTECYALFPSRANAEAVTGDLRERAPDLGIVLETERRGGRTVATIGTSESGADARPLTTAFRRTVRAHGGQLGHPDEGCIEREPLM